MISNVDITDYIQENPTQPVKKLFELPRNSYFNLGGIEYFLDHIDGMFSCCYDNEGRLFHISAFCEVEPTGKVHIKAKPTNKKGTV